MSCREYQTPFQIIIQKREAAYKVIFNTRDVFVKTYFNQIQGMKRLEQVFKVSSCFPVFTGKAHLIGYPQSTFGQVLNECRVLITSS